MLHWTIEPITLDLKYTWKISRNSSDQKTNLIVTVSDGIHSGKGEAAPNVRYDESAEEGIKLFPRFTEVVAPEITNSRDLHPAIRSSGIFNSLSFAIESAWLRLQEKKTGRSIYDLAAIPQPAKILTSYTIPIMETGSLKKFYADNRLDRFPFIKLKVNYEDAYESLRHLLTFSNKPVMVDANESFRDVEECIRYLEKIRSMPIVFVEQPLPSSMIEESEYMKRYSPFDVFADESMTDEADFSRLRKSFDGVNMKLMKAGGMMNGIRLLTDARKAGMKTMIGCMVETTLGISSAMTLCGLTDYADLDSFILIKDEPFGLVEEKNGELLFKRNADDADVYDQ